LPGHTRVSECTVCSKWPRSTKCCTIAMGSKATPHTVVKPSGHCFCCVSSDAHGKPSI
jgi:hypothetical protein